MDYFCTYFDSNYLLQGLALHDSLQKQCNNYKIFILCLDDDCYGRLTAMSLAHVELISLPDFERGDAELLQAKENRSRIEYYFTCTPSLVLYILRNYPEVDLITYLDSDLFFFGNPEPIFAEIGENSVAIVGHRYHEALKHLEIFGKYNVAWLSFRRDERGLACLTWYRERCNEWCYDRVEEDRFADQKYLDYFQSRFEGVIELHHKGADLAPWNINNYKISKSSHRVYVDDDPLIFFHFHGLKNIFGSFYDSGLFNYKSKLNKTIRDEIYKPYLACLSRLANNLGYATKIDLSNETRFKKEVKCQTLYSLMPNIYTALKNMQITWHCFQKGSLLHHR